MKNPETASSLAKPSKKKPINKTPLATSQSERELGSIWDLLKNHGVLLWRIGMSIVMLMTLFVGLIVMEKLTHLQEQKLLEYGGKANAEQLEQLYQNPHYADYFKNEIELLEKRVDAFAKTVSK